MVGKKQNTAAVRDCRLRAHSPTLLGTPVWAPDGPLAEIHGPTKSGDAGEKITRMRCKQTRTEALRIGSYTREIGVCKRAARDCGR